MPSRAVTSFLLDTVSTYEKNKYGVSMPSRAVTSFLLVCIADRYWNSGMGVNALSGCYLISTTMYPKTTICLVVCQCPLGLLPHFYSIQCPHMRKTSMVCQCPLGLLPHFYVSCRDNKAYSSVHRVNALSGCYLISTTGGSGCNKG